MSQELKTSTNDVMKIEIQHQLEEAEGKIRQWKEKVNEYQRQVNEHSGKLGPLKKEGELSSMIHLPCHMSQLQVIHLKLFYDNLLPPYCSNFSLWYYICLTLGAHAHEYSTHSVCVKSLLTSFQVYTTK